MSILNGESSGGNLSGIKNASGSSIPLWNYSQMKNKDGNPRPDYSQELVGTIIDIKEVQATKYQSNELEWWDAEKTQPKMDIEIAIAKDDGSEAVWHIKPGSSSNYNKFSIARKAIIDALRKATGDPSTIDMTKLPGYRVKITTEDMVTPDGKVIPYGAGNPRPWNVDIAGKGDETKVLFGKTSSVVTPEPAQPTATPQVPVQEQAYGTENIPF